MKLKKKPTKLPYNWIRGALSLMKMTVSMPPVSDEDDLELEDGDIVRNISVNINATKLEDE